MVNQTTESQAANHQSLEHLLEDILLVKTRLLRERKPDPLSNKGTEYARDLVNIYAQVSTYMKKFADEIDAQAKSVSEDMAILKEDSRKVLDETLISRLRDADRKAKVFLGPAEKLVQLYDDLYSVVQRKQVVIPIYEENMDLVKKLRAYDASVGLMSDKAKRQIADSKSLYANMEGYLSALEIEMRQREALGSDSDVPYIHEADLQLVEELPALGPNDTHPYIDPALVNAIKSYRG